MSSTVEAQKPAAEKRPAQAKPVKEKKTKAAPKQKKPKAAKTAAAHPTYFEMIKEALTALKEKSGSSPHAIAKFMEDKHKAELPANFRKILGLQLKNSATKGKLIKVKASYKLSESEKKNKVTVSKPAAAKKTAPAAKKTAPAAKKTDAAAATKKPKTAAKAPAAAAGTKRKAEVAKKKVAQKKVVKKAVTPAKAKQPKSIKSPVAKRAKRATAA